MLDTDILPDDDGLAEQRTATRLCRGVRRLLWTQRYASVTEFPLANGRRADIFGVTTGCDIVIVEVKSSIVDFKTDQKWQEYRAFCDTYFFAVCVDFPKELIPGHCGLIVGDAFGAAVIRPSPIEKLPTPRRKTLIHSFGQLAATRLHRLEDPMLGGV
ncbi:MAG: repair protein MmcB-related protein [Rhodospirillales bacterium]|nr:repair protein MmcB-related protein [Rhodospirillales bacterium]